MNKDELLERLAGTSHQLVSGTKVPVDSISLAGLIGVILEIEADVANLKERASKFDSPVTGSVNFVPLVYSDLPEGSSTVLKPGITLDKAGNPWKDGKRVKKSEAFV